MHASTVTQHHIQVSMCKKVICEWVVSHRNESIIEFTHECVISHTNASSCHIRMRHTYKCVMSNMNASRHIWMSHVTYEWVKYKWVVSYTNEPHIWMSHVTYERAMSHMKDSTQQHIQRVPVFLKRRDSEWIWKWHYVFTRDTISCFFGRAAIFGQEEKLVKWSSWWNDSATCDMI